MKQPKMTFSQIHFQTIITKHNVQGPKLRNVIMMPKVRCEQKESLQHESE